ncbi:MAG: cytochrome c biogenesis protein CcsA [Verrucomicrobia bacterium]|nr:cytochrome c biogenesis protein CcsA [Deltaproteobacteria bacterium]
MAQYEMTLFWIAVACYGIAAICYIFGLLARKEALFNCALSIVVVGFCGNLGSVVLRWIAGGVPPFIAISESLASGVLIAVFVFLIAQFVVRNLEAAGVLVMPVCFILLGWAGTLMKGIGSTMPPALQSTWLWTHIFAATIGFSCVLFAAALGFLFLLKENQSGGVYEKLPGLQRLDELGYRFISGGFVFLGLMMVSGALWSNQVKGNYWNWDPVEVWSLISWLVYGIYLHLRITMGWRNRRLAIYALSAVVVMIISYWGIPFVSENFHTGFRIEH